MEIDLTSPYEPAPPMAHVSGPWSAPIAIVGEAWGRDEDEAGGVPFVGAAGRELNAMLTEAGLSRDDVFCTNVLAFRPRDNKYDYVTVGKKDLEASTTNGSFPEWRAHTTAHGWPAIDTNKWLHPRFAPELLRLAEELSRVRPVLVVPMGNKACWALLSVYGISKLRGVAAPSTLLPGQKCLPTFHPSYVLRQWDARTIVLADLMKAKREAEFREIRRPQRSVLIDPTVREIIDWFRRPAQLYSVDIETAKRQITCIGFARSASDAIVIPFWNKRQKGYHAWTENDEIHVWYLVKRALESQVPKLFQNGLYDLQYIARMGIRPRNCLHDTMLEHHALFPEMQKDLGFLGSVYTDEASWKLMRNRSKDSEKREE